MLDLYAGSGAIGFEALSRGASHVTFVEMHSPSAARIRMQAEQLGVADRVDVIAAPVERAIRRLSGPYDLVYADPPYAQVLPPAVIAGLRSSGAIDEHTLVVYEHRARQAVPVEGLQSQRLARYGEVALEFMVPFA